MSDKVEHWVAQNLPFLYAIVLSVWGGFVQYANRVRAGERWSWASMLLDLVVCSFAGLIAFFACQAAGIKDWQAAIVIAVTAHEGTRAIGLLVQFRDKVLGIDSKVKEK